MKLTRAFVNRIQAEREKESICKICNKGTMREITEIGDNLYLFVCSNCGHKVIR